MKEFSQQIQKSRATSGHLTIKLLQGTLISITTSSSCSTPTPPTPSPTPWPHVSHPCETPR